MTIPEPKTLLVGLSAWRLVHSKASPGRHGAPDDCAWAPTPDCTFTISVATRLDALDTGFLDVPLVPATSVAGLPPLDPVFAPQTVAEIPFAGTPPILIRVKAEPTAQLTIKGFKGQPPRPDPVNTVGFFEGTGFFVYEGQGVWKRHSRSVEEDERLSADLFAPPMSMAGVLQGPFVFTVIPFFLSRVRDRTRQALGVLQQREPDREVWVKPSADFDHLDTPPIGQGKVRMVQTKIDLASDVRVLEVKGFKAPALVAVCWPKKNDLEPATGVAPFLRAAPMESLLFFHASFGQNAAIYNTTPYPFGFKQMDHGFFSYLNPAKHPLRNVYPLGIPYQVAAAGKQTVTILPLNRVGFPELTNLNDGEQAAELFEEIHSAYLRFSGRYFTAPQLGRIALASFSAAIQELMLFHRAANATPLLKALIEEVFIFEPIHSNAAQVGTYANAFKSWAGAVPARRVRVYSNEAGPNLSDFVGRALPTPPFVVDSADSRFTTGVVTDANWLQSSSGRDGLVFGAQKPGPFRLTLTQTAPIGAITLTVRTVGAIQPGDRIDLLGFEVRRVVTVTGRQITLDRPITREVGKSNQPSLIEKTGFKTVLADAVAPGDRSLLVADAVGFYEDATVVLGDRILVVDDIVGNLLLLRGVKLAEPMAKGTAVELRELGVRTTLAADHPAGSTVLRVINAGAGFAAGQSIAIGPDTESAKIAVVGPDTLTLAEPTKKDHRRGALVGPMTPRVLFWGLYHAMFVTIMLTDAMRKSGFR